MNKNYEDFMDAIQSLSLKKRELEERYREYKKDENPFNKYYIKRAFYKGKTIAIIGETHSHIPVKGYLALPRKIIKGEMPKPFMLKASNPDLEIDLNDSDKGTIDFKEHKEEEKFLINYLKKDDINKLFKLYVNL